MFQSKIIDELPAREAAVRCWKAAQKCEDRAIGIELVRYAVGRLNQCSHPSKATAAVLAAYAKQDSGMDCVSAFARLRKELKEESALCGAAA